MGGEVRTESWFSNLWRVSRKGLALEPEKAIGILTFEVAALMSKVVCLWQCLNDNQITRLREEIANSVGIRKLVSDDADYLMDLALAELVDNLTYVVTSVARLGKGCTNPTYQGLEQILDDPVDIDLKWCGWRYRLKKMERKVRKMERYVAVTAQLYQELEVLAELEQSLRRMQANVDINKLKLLEFQQKVLWQRHEVKSLREMSPWVRSYDYIIRLLLRSLFTVIERIEYMFGMNEIGAAEGSQDSGCVGNKGLVRCHSISVHPSANDLFGFQSGPVGRSVSNLGLSGDRNRLQNKKLHARHQSFILHGKDSQRKTRSLNHVGPLKGCMMGATDSPVLQSCMPSGGGFVCSNGVLQKEIVNIAKTNLTNLSYSDENHPKISLFSFKHKLLNASPATLGDAALALHYANVIILIEKLASSPHLIGHDARDDLYNMLPTRVRTSLRSKLKVFTKTLASSIYNPTLAAEWSIALTRVLEWLAPLAHNMIKWHSERNFEKQCLVSGPNVLLVQTLYFANQAKTEAAITELLMGLNYLSKFGRELSEMAFLESACNRASGDYLLHKDRYYSV